MDTDTEIREYESKDQAELRRFYCDMENKKRTSRVLHTLRQRSSAKRTWQAGLVAELLLWSAGLSIFCFKMIGQENDAELDRNCQQMADELATIRKSEKSNVWVMTKQGHIIGSVAFKYESGEGIIGFLRGIDPQTRLLLLKNAFRFGRANNITVVSKWKDDMKWSESNFNFTLRTTIRSLDQFPMHCLFSPTALDHDLSYVDKTYYSNQQQYQQHYLPLLSNSDEKHQNEKHQTSVQTIVLNKTIGLVTSVSRLDLRNIGLFVLPTQVALLTRLTILDLSHNKLVKLPSNIDQLRNLKHLNLSYNNITHLPASIYSLTKLTHFDVSYNPITRISANIARLHCLNFLDLSSTNISSIPAELLNLFMTVIKTDHCPRLLDQSMELQQRTTHNPLGLVEICARQIIQPILYDIMAKKKKRRELKEMQKQRYKIFQQLPNHIIYYLSRPKACSSCGGPYFQSFVVRYRIVQRQDESWIPVEYRLCSAHWNTERERVLSLFSEIPTSSLPSSKEPCHLKLVPSNSIDFDNM
ncbi:hypothetical protein [Parasitella parasitica]|uniref:Uncharacterized protein n=1 Tax=Parasitella parasitica TaxID=35722 RepID=A0A0B7N2T9_9FUNG|nr:hypothetical protein [Parasitella parasitica]